MPTYTHRRAVTIPGSNGRRTYLTGHGSTLLRAKMDSQRRVDEYKAGLTARKQMPTLAVYTETWLTERKALRTKQQTVGAARTAIRRLLPYLGTLRLDQLDPPTIQRALVALVGKGYAPHTIHHSRGILSEILTAARKDRLISENPVPDTEGPRLVPKDKRVLSAAEADHFLASVEAEGNPHWPAFVLLLTYPMRIGELLGLRWGDVRVDELVIAGQVVRQVGGKPERVPYAKTRGSLRTLPMTPEVVRALAWQHARVRDTSVGGLVFPTARRGEAQWSSTLLKALKRAMVRAGLPAGTLHLTRHSVITSLRMAGNDPRVVAALSGHSSLTMSDHYTHPSRADMRAAVERRAEGDVKRKQGAG